MSSLFGQAFAGHMAARRQEYENASWYDRINNSNYGGTGNFQDWRLGSNSFGNYEGDEVSGSIEDITNRVGGLRYLDADRTTAVDRNGTTYQRTGDNQWSRYNTAMGENQSRYNAGGYNLFGNLVGAHDTGWGTGKNFATGEGDALAASAWGGEGTGYQRRQSAAYALYNAQNEARLGGQNADASAVAATSNGPLAAPETPVANPVNHTFIQGLQSQIQNNQSAALASAQEQATSNANMMRLAAGADTLGGNYAAAGAAGQSALANEQQGDLAQANYAQAQAQQQNMGLLGQALQQQASTDISAKGAQMDQTMQNISDVIDSLKQDIGQMSTEQQQQIQAYINTLSGYLQQYQNLSGADAQSQQERMGIAGTALQVAGTIAAFV